MRTSALWRVRLMANRWACLPVPRRRQNHSAQYFLLPIFLTRHAKYLPPQNHRSVLAAGYICPSSRWPDSRGTATLRIDSGKTPSQSRFERCPLPSARAAFSEIASSPAAFEARATPGRDLRAVRTHSRPGPAAEAVVDAEARRPNGSILLYANMFEGMEYSWRGGRSHCVHTAVAADARCRWRRRDGGHNTGGCVTPLCGVAPEPGTPIDGDGHLLSRNMFALR